MARNSSEVEQAVSRTLRDSLAKLQQTTGELDRAVNDLVSACASARASNSLPPMLRARSAAASLAASLEVLSKFVLVALQSAPAEEELLSAERGPASAGATAELVELAEPTEPVEPVQASVAAEPVFAEPAFAETGTAESSLAEAAPVAMSLEMRDPAPQQVPENIPEREPGPEPVPQREPGPEQAPGEMPEREPRPSPDPGPEQVPQREPEREQEQEQAQAREQEQSPEPVDSFAQQDLMPVAEFSSADPPAPSAASYNENERLPQEAAGFNVLELAPEQQELHRRASRVAKVSMQDVKMLRPGDVALGKEHKDLCVRLRDDIEKAHKEYDRRFHSIMDHPVDYFYNWMVQILGDGDPETLGEYPYPSPVLRR